MLKQKTKKWLSAILVCGLVVIEMVPVGASAATLTIPDSLSSDAMSIPGTTPSNSAENDSGGLSNKQPGPKVEVTFNSNGPLQQGSLMTATAVPGFFNDSSDPKKLYFTWYLKRLNCGLSNGDDPGNVSKCDLDGDEKITENDWKIAATKIIVKGEFDKNEANYDVSIDSELSGFEAIPSPTSEWEINSGKDSNDEDAPNCYIQEPVSGSVYEMRRVTPIFNPCPDDAAGNSYKLACGSDQAAKCDVLNPEYTQENIDIRQAEINAVNAWNSDPANFSESDYPRLVPTQIEETISNDFGACAVSTESTDDMNCEISNKEDLKNFTASLSCNAAGGVPLCVREDEFTTFPINATDPLAETNPLLGIIFSKNSLADISKKEDICSSLATPNPSAPPNFLDNTQPAISVTDSKCSAVKYKMLNGTKDSAGTVVTEGNTDFNPTCSFKKDVNMCKHLFPDFPENIVTVDGKALDMSGSVAGDGKFSIAEKQFWGADPAKVSTNGIGKDEANVIGLGVDKFTWMYSPGDMVGVVVEGDSAFPTGHADSSYKRMWAFSNNSCKALEDLDKSSNITDGDENEGKRGFYIEGTGASKLGFLTAEVDLDDCLEENLLEPDENGTAKLTVQLNASPENPINDPSGRGDILNIVSGATNTQDQAGLLYKWSVQKSLDGSVAPIDTTNWIDITSALVSGGSFSDSDKEGLGKKDLAINLNIKDAIIESGMASDSYDGTFYLRVKVKIAGTAADGSQNAEGMVIVRIKQQQNEMHVYPVNATSAGMLSLNKGSGNESMEYCNDQLGKTRCYVAKNQILGIEIPDSDNSNLTNFSWKVNGNDIACSSSISSECKPGGNILFVPVLGNEGEAIDVKATALNEKGESIEMSRHFVIGKAGLQILFLDSNISCSLDCLINSNVCPKYLGHYKDLSGNQYPDCSTQVWQTNEGKTITIGATGQTGFDWAIDGQIISEYKDKNQIQLIVNKSAGESYNIGLSTHLLPGNTAQLNNMRMALYRNWGVAPEDAIEENQSANIQIDVVDGLSQQLSAEKSSFFGASLITHLPQQLMFLLKISLTSILIILSTGLLFAFIPETLFKKEEN